MPTNEMGREREARSEPLTSEEIGELERLLAQANNIRLPTRQRQDANHALRRALPRLLSSLKRGKEEAYEEMVGRLELHWKSCMSRGDKRGDDMAGGINLAIEAIRSLSPKDKNEETDG